MFYDKRYVHGSKSQQKLPVENKSIETIYQSSHLQHCNQWIHISFDLPFSYVTTTYNSYVCILWSIIYLIKFSIKSIYVHFQKFFNVGVRFGIDWTGSCFSPWKLFRDVVYLTKFPERTLSSNIDI